MTGEPFVSYAQNHEDVVLARALHPDREPGFWIDVGAGDPLLESVTAAFSERGWSGINIEPLALEYEQLRARRPFDTNLGIALGATSGRSTLFQGPEHDRGASTMRSDVVASRGAEAGSFTSVDVSVCTLAEIVAEYVRGPVDFLKIDVEGQEYDVLAGADFTTFRPRALVIEATIPNTTKPSHEIWEPLLLDAGYRCALFDGLNRFYANEDEPDLFEALSIPANVFDNFVSYRWVLEFAKSAEFADDLTSQVEGLRSDHDNAIGALADKQAEMERTSAEIARVNEEITRVHADAMLAWRAARYGQDEARIAEERASVLQEELAASQVLCARALAEVVAARDAVAVARGEIDAARAALTALEATRTFRYTAGVRSKYSVVRRLLRLN